MNSTTERLYIVPGTLPLMNLIVAEDWPGLSSALGGVDLAEHWMHFPEAMFWMREYLQEHPDEADWWCHLIIHRKDIRLIGTCGFKGSPSPDGVVEIGYEIADGYQGQGLAKEAARALVEHAFAQPAVQSITAHTLAEENASVAVLRKLGFAFAEELFDIEDGRIWKWALGRT